MQRLSIPTVIVAALVVAILITYMVTHQVSFYQQAVKVHLGHADESSVIREPGLKFRWPWPIEQIQTYDTRLQTLDAPETEVKTVDGKNLIVGTYALWKIEDPLRFYNRVKTMARAEEQLRARIAQQQATVVGQKTVPFFVNLDRHTVDANYDQFVAEMKAGVEQSLFDDFGIRVVEVGIRRISLPREVTQEVFKSMTEDRKRYAARFREEGKSRAEAIKARAESDAKQILAFADRKAQEIRSAGIQASTRILSQIESGDREFFEWLRWLEMIKASLAQRTTIFIDKDWPLFKPFVEPPNAAPPSTPAPAALQDAAAKEQP